MPTWWEFQSTQIAQSWQTERARPPATRRGDTRWQRRKQPRTLSGKSTNGMRMRLTTRAAMVSGALDVRKATQAVGMASSGVQKRTMTIAPGTILFRPRSVARSGSRALMYTRRTASGYTNRLRARRTWLDRASFHVTPTARTGKT